MVYAGKKLAGFTIGELAVTFIIIAIITAATMKVSASRVEYAQKQVAKATFNNVKSAVGNLIADGYVSGTTTLKQLNTTAHAADNSGFCDRMASTLNTVPIIISGGAANSNCAASAVTDSGPFDDAHLNFKTSNGAKYYNFGKDAVGGQYTVYIDISTGKNQGTLNSTPLNNFSSSLSSISLNGSVIKFFIKTDGTVSAVP